MNYSCPHRQHKEHGAHAPDPIGIELRVHTSWLAFDMIEQATEPRDNKHQSDKIDEYLHSLGPPFLFRNPLGHDHGTGVVFLRLLIEIAVRRNLTFR